MTFLSTHLYDTAQDNSTLQRQRLGIEKESSTCFYSESSSAKYESDQSDSQFEKNQKETYLGWCLNDDYEAQQNSFNNGSTPINNSFETSSHLFPSQCSTDILSKTSREASIPYSFSFGSDFDRNRNMCYSSTFEFEPDLQPSYIRPTASFSDLDPIPSTQPTMIRYGEYLASKQETNYDYRSDSDRQDE